MPLVWSSESIPATPPEEKCVRVDRTTRHCWSVACDGSDIREQLGSCWGGPLMASHFTDSMVSSPNSSSSAGSCLGVASSLETQLSLITSRHEILLLVALPPLEPQPSENVWRITPYPKSDHHCVVN